MAQEDNKEESIEDFLKANKLLNSELLGVLNANGIYTTEDIKENIETANEIDTTIKQVRKRTEKILQKFVEKVTAITGLEYEYKPPRHRHPTKKSSKMDVSHKNTDSYLSPTESPRSKSPRNRTRTHSNTSNTSIGSGKGQPSKTPKEIRRESNANNANDMRMWLQDRHIFHKDLFDYLATHGYNSPEDLVALPETKFDDLVRQVRVETFRELKDSAKRNRVDRLLVKFEKEWRKYSGIRKTNMTKEQQEQWGYSPRQSFDDTDDMDFEG